MTWNIAAGAGGLAAIADGIRLAAPDVVALQEVDVHWSERSRFEDQAAGLARLLGMAVAFGPIYQLPGEQTAPVREFGVAILSRLVPSVFRNHAIPRLSTQSADPTPRLLPGFLEAVFELSGTRIRVFNTHLDYRADPAVRAQQVAAMLEILNRGEGPAVLMGDLNAPPTAAELRPLLQPLMDAWPDPDGGLTYPAGTPVRRIDYILTSRDLRASNVRVLPVRISDHRPVLADVERVRQHTP